MNDEDVGPNSTNNSPVEPPLETTPTGPRKADDETKQLVRRQIIVVALGLALFASVSFNSLFVTWFDASAGPLIGAVSAVIALILVLFAPEIPSAGDMAAWRKAAGKLALDHSETDRATKRFAVTSAFGIVLVWAAGAGSARSIEVTAGDSERIRYSLWTGTLSDMDCKGDCVFRAWVPLFLSPPDVVCLPGSTPALFSGRSRATCPQTAEYTVLDVHDDVDFSQWQPDQTQGKSKVTRTLRWTVQRNRTSAGPFMAVFGTSKKNIRYELLSPRLAIIEPVEPSPSPPRRLFRVTLPTSATERGVPSVLAYRIEYEDNFDLHAGPPEELRKCASCDLSLRMPNASVRHYVLTVSGFSSSHPVTRVLRLRSDSGVREGTETSILESPSGVDDFVDVENGTIPAEARLSYFIAVRK